MAGTPTVYGDISPRTAVFAIMDMLKRGMPHLHIEKFGQTYILPTNSSKVASFRRMFLENATPGSGTEQGLNPPLATTALTEGVTPAGSKLDVKDITVTIAQYGDFVTISDVVRDTHEDPVLRQATEILGEQAAQTIETLRYNVLKAGTNVVYANGAARASVNTPMTLVALRKATRALKRQNARPITSVTKSTPDFNTEQTEAAFVCLIHPDLENDIRGITGYINTKEYGTAKPFEGEVGSIEDIRFVRSTLFTPFADAGDTKGLMISTTGTDADVYPSLLIAKDAYGLVPLKGKTSIMPVVSNPRPSDSDPLAQRGSVGWKAYTATVILNDAWMVRLESGATD